MRWGVLGPLLVTDDAGTDIRVPAGRLRTLLAVLLMRANQPVPLDEIVDVLWDGTPPAAATRTARVYVARLRQVLGPSAGARVLTRSRSYLCQVDHGEFDLLRFQTLCRHAHRTLADQHHRAVRSRGTRPAIGDRLCGEGHSSGDNLDSRRKPINPLLAIESLWHNNASLIRLLSLVDSTCDGSLTRMSQQDYCEIDVRRHMRRVGVKQMLRAEQPGLDRWVLTYDWEQTSWYAPQITGLENCRLGRTAADCNAHVLVAELLFDRPLDVGETITMEYQVINPPQTRPNLADVYCRRQRLVVHNYDLDIQFSPDALPAGCRLIKSQVDTAQKRHRNMAVDGTGAVHLSATDVRPGLLGIEWNWALRTPNRVAG